MTTNFFSLPFSDHDLERLYEQWEEDEEPLELDELPEWDPRKPQPSIDFSKLDMSDTDNGNYRVGRPFIRDIL